MFIGILALAMGMGGIFAALVMVSGGPLLAGLAVYSGGSLLGALVLLAALVLLLPAQAGEATHRRISGH